MNGLRGKYRFAGRCPFLVFVIVSGLLIGCGSGDNNDNQQCRLYATEYLSSGDGITNGYPNIPTPIGVNCAFDPNRSTLTCSAQYIDQYGSPARITKSRGYASVSDFVEEARVMGLTLSLSYEFGNDGFGPDSIIHKLYGDGVNVFDSRKRLISTDHLRFKSWDPDGRPTESEPTGISTGDTGIRFEYNDQDRTVAMYSNTRTSTQPGAGMVPCIPIKTSIKFDTHGNVILLQLPSGAAVYDIVKMEAVCVEE